MKAASAMDLIVMHVTQCDEIVDRVFTAILVMLSVVQFQHFARIVTGRHRSVPAALNALKAVALQNRHPHGIRYRAVVFVGLPVFFEDVDADC
jgi:hypothetical protein